MCINSECRSRLAIDEITWCSAPLLSQSIGSPNVELIVSISSIQLILLSNVLHVIEPVPEVTVQKPIIKWRCLVQRSVDAWNSIIASYSISFLFLFPTRLAVSSNSMRIYTPVRLFPTDQYRLLCTLSYLPQLIITDEFFFRCGFEPEMALPTKSFLTLRWLLLRYQFTDIFNRDVPQITWFQSSWWPILMYRRIPGNCTHSRFCDKCQLQISLAIT